MAETAPPCQSPLFGQYLGNKGENGMSTTQDGAQALENLPVPAARIEAALKEIDFADPTLSISYGAHTMSEISRFADSLLGNVRVKDSGPVGNTLADLMGKLKQVDIGGIAQPQKGFLASLPLIGSLFDRVGRTVARFDTVLGQVEAISAKLEESMFSLLKDIEILEQMYGHNKNFYEELSACIEAGERKLEEARRTELPRLEEEARSGGGNLAAQNVRDFADRLNRFERRLHDLRLSRTITLQTAPQIRMIQGNDQTLAEKIQTSILATIPVWKNQMVLALSLHGQREAARMQKEVADTTNTLLRQNADMLNAATVETAQEVERGIVDMQTLRDVHEKLLHTIEETLTIAREGRERRRASEAELQKLESDLRERLTDMAATRREESIAAAHGSTPLPSADGQGTPRTN